jgi:hypothetical protein
MLVRPDGVRHEMYVLHIYIGAAEKMMRYYPVYKIGRVLGSAPAHYRRHAE